MNKLDLSDNKNRILPKLLTLQAQQAGTTEFLITDERRLTFAEAEQLANAMAAGLRELGVQKDDRVAFYLDNGWEPVLIALAVNKLGAVWVPLNTDYKGAWLSETIERSRCTGAAAMPVTPWAASPCGAFALKRAMAMATSS